MPRVTKEPTVEEAIDQLLDIVAENVRQLMEERIRGTNKPLALAAATRLGKGTIQRVLGGSKGYGRQTKSAAAIDTLLRLAWYFRVPITSLFVRRDMMSVVLGPHEISEGSRLLESSGRELKSP